MPSRRPLSARFLTSECRAEPGPALTALEDVLPAITSLVQQPAAPASTLAPTAAPISSNPILAELQMLESFVANLLALNSPAPATDPHVRLIALRRERDPERVTEGNMNNIAFAMLAAAAAASAFAADAPETFAYLWLLKAAAAAFMSVGSLLLHPPGSAPAAPAAPKEPEPEQPVLPTWQAGAQK
jgi:hypothetical protein